MTTWLGVTLCVYIVLSAAAACLGDRWIINLEQLAVPVGMRKPGESVTVTGLRKARAAWGHRLGTSASSRGLGGRAPSPLGAWARAKIHQTRILLKTGDYTVGITGEVGKRTATVEDAKGNVRFKSLPEAKWSKLPAWA